MSDFDGVGAGDVMTLEECAVVIGDLESRLAAAEADAERLLSAARRLSDETKEARKHYASVMTFSMVCAMDRLEQVVLAIDKARGAGDE